MRNVPAYVQNFLVNLVWLVVVLLGIFFVGMIVVVAPFLYICILAGQGELTLEEATWWGMTLLSFTSAGVVTAAIHFQRERS